MLDKDVSLAEKIRMLFREQGIMIASIIMAIGMAISVLVEALLLDGGRTGSVSAAGGSLCQRMKRVNESGTNLKPWLKSIPWTGRVLFQ